MKSKFIVVFVTLMCIINTDNVMAQIAKWADDKYVKFLECLNVYNDYDGAKAELISLSEQGDSQARCCLATMLCFGERNDRDYSQALDLLIKSANDNYERAEYLLGCFGSLERSREVVRLIIGDDSMEEEADNGFWAQCFKSSNFEVKTFQDAFNWFLMKDGYWGYKDIMYYSGLQYLNGSYGVVDVQKALKWLGKSKELGSKEAEELLDQINSLMNKKIL